MAELILIQKLPHVHGLHGHKLVRLQAERATLAKRRWRGVAGDGREFGFDLDATMTDGTPFYIENDIYYVIAQVPEEVVEVPVTSIKDAARIAWSLGNLHFGVEVRADAVRVSPDPAVLQFLAREHVTYRKLNAVFLPQSAAAHHHGHGHPHG